MPHSLFGIFFAAILTGIVVLVLIIGGVYLFSITEISGGTFGSRLLTYSNVDWGLSLRYPSDFIVNTEYTYDTLGVQKQIMGIAFSVPPKKTEGTNLSHDTHISVEVIPNMPSCSARMFVTDSKNLQSLVDNSIAYSYASIENYGAGNAYEEQVYALSGSSPCVAVRYSIHSTNIDNYDFGTVMEYDRDDLLSAFDSMRWSLSIKK